MSGTTEALIQFQTQLVTSSITKEAAVTAYAAGDAVSNATGNTHHTFSNALRPGILSGSIPTAICHSSAQKSAVVLPDLELWLFRTDIAVIVDNAAFTITDAEMATLIGVIDFPVADWKTGDPTADTGNSVCIQTNLGLVIQAAVPAIYGQLVIRNAYTPVSGEVFTVDLLVTQD